MVRVVELGEGGDEVSSVRDPARVVGAPEPCAGASEPPVAVHTARDNSSTRGVRNNSCGEHVDKGSRKPEAGCKASIEAGAHGGETRSITCPTTSSSQSNKVDASSTRGACSTGTLRTLTMEGDPTGNFCCGGGHKIGCPPQDVGVHLVQDVWCDVRGVEGAGRHAKDDNPLSRTSFLCHSAHGDRSCDGNRCEIGPSTSLENWVSRDSGAWSASVRPSSCLSLVRN